MSGDIIGHFDLVTKFDREEKIFTPKEARYKKAALSAIEKLCSKNSVFEVRGFSFGLVVRVYLYRANIKTPACTKAIMDRLSRGWYKNLVWVAQVVDVTEEGQMKSLQKELDQALIDTLESERGKKR